MACTSPLTVSSRKIGRQRSGRRSPAGDDFRTHEPGRIRPSVHNGDMNIVVDDLSGPEIAAFLNGHVEQMRSITPAEFAFALNLDELRKPDVTFWTAWDDGVLVG